MTTNLTADAIARAVLDCKGLMHARADSIADAFDLGNAETLHLIWRGLTGHFRERTPIENDGREALWRCRFRFYKGDAAEPEADSDPELPADAPGTQLVKGLPGVASMVLEYARMIHDGAQLSGLSSQALNHSIKGLRPTLARNKGRAAWRLRYNTLETFTDGQKKPGWIARVDIIREPRAA